MPTTLELAILATALVQANTGGLAQQFSEAEQSEIAARIEARMRALLLLPA